MKLLKEWAISCKALDEGRQIFIARKGGIAEEEGEFVVQDKEFFLYPVYLHQTKDLIKPAYHLNFDLTASQEPTDKKIHIRNFAKVTDSWKITNFEILKKLEPEHIWNDTLLKQRFEWGNELGLTIVVLRVYHLLEEITISMKKEYGGCSSWVEVNTKKKIPQMMPVLSEREFAERRASLRLKVGP